MPDEDKNFYIASILGRWPNRTAFLNSITEGRGDRVIYKFENGHTISEDRWHENGQKRYEARYENGQMISEDGWHENGQKSYEYRYENGHTISTDAWYENGQKVNVDAWYENGQKSYEAR
jgi:antitoxin component YwqK of YwqJK toxin-antitoxin module